jgi:hypothetical protein
MPATPTDRDPKRRKREADGPHESALCFAWVALGSWVAVFPGTLDRSFGLSYDFQEVWGVAAGEFELFTLGTLAALGVLGAVEYLTAKPLRVEQRDTEQSPFRSSTAATEGLLPRGRSTGTRSG